MVDQDPNSFKDAVESASADEEKAHVLLEMFGELQRLLEDAENNVNKGILKRIQNLQKRVKEDPQTKRKDEDINEKEDEFPKIILKGTIKWVNDRIGQAPLLIKARMEVLNDFFVKKGLKDIEDYYQQLNDLQDEKISMKLGQISQGISYHFSNAVGKVKDIRQSIAQNPCLKLNECKTRLPLE